MKLSELTRRSWLKNVGLGLGAAAAGASFGSEEVRADFVTKKVAKRGTEYSGAEATPCTFANGKVTRPAAEIPTISETDVLVVGGGPAGCCAAIAAARAGVKATIVERYNHFGGLATGGLVVHILGHWTKNPDGSKVQVVQGLGEEMMKRLESLPNGICHREFGRNPTVDSEVYKYLLVEMLMEDNVEVFLHSWAIDSIVDDNPDPKTGNPVVKGILIQTKLGPHAILAKQVIDCTGDGDVFATCGCAYTRRLYHIGLPCRLGNLDKIKLQPGQKLPGHLIGSVTPVKGVNWVNMGGPDADGLDVRELTRLELNHRRQIWKNYVKLKNTPGCEEVFLLETAPQMGVRITRVIEGTEELTLEGARNAKKFDSCVGYGGAWGGDHIGWQIPYGCLLSKNVENILTAGRTICGAPDMSELLRVIPNCWSSGHSAGVAAAVAVKSNCTARDVNLTEVRRILTEQKAYLG
ncbi:MAG: FAD-dependent oxidoreductase [Thermoguttaceae bacterium]|nr:FAD-dependent oxidoreductase [Thermoguttaceae bacterium]